MEPRKTKHSVQLALSCAVRWNHRTLIRELQTGFMGLAYDGMVNIYTSKQDSDFVCYMFYIEYCSCGSVVLFVYMNT